MAWLTGWDRRKSKIITGTTAGSQTNYLMMFSVKFGSGTDSGNVIYLGSNVKTDFSDLRFTTSDGQTLLNYWIDPNTLVSGTSVNVWIQIPSIPVSPSTTSIYIYYQNPSVTDASSISIFNFFEDFGWTGNNNTYRETGWANTDATKFSLVSNQLQITNFYNNRNNQMYNNNARVGAIGQSFELQFDAIGTLGSWDPWLLIGLRSGTITANSGPAIYAAIRGGGVSGSVELYYVSPIQSLAYGTNISAKASGVNSTRLYYTLSSYVSAGISNARLDVYSNVARTINVGSATLTYTPFIPSVFDCPDYMRYDPANNNYFASANVDNIRVRQYVSPEPTFGSSGTEEFNITAISMSLNSNSCLGPCSITATVTWQNLGASSVTFRPAILVDGTTIFNASSDITIAAGGTGPSSITTAILPVGNHSICPNPN